MCSRYYCVLSLMSFSLLFGMMEEEVIQQRVGKKVLQDELPAAICLLVRDYLDRTFPMRRHSYQMNERRTLLALEGGTVSVVKIFEHKDGGFREIQEIKDSCNPTLDLEGNSLVVVKKTKNPPYYLEYYLRNEQGSFESQSALDFPHAISDIAFTDDGTRLVVQMLVGANKYESQEFKKNLENTLEPIGILQRICDSVFGK